MANNGTKLVAQECTEFYWVWLLVSISFLAIIQFFLPSGNQLNTVMSWTELECTESYWVLLLGFHKRTEWSRGFSLCWSSLVVQWCVPMIHCCRDGINGLIHWCSSSSFDLFFFFTFFFAVRLVFSCIFFWWGLVAVCVDCFVLEIVAIEERAALPEKKSDDGGGGRIARGNVWEIIRIQRRPRQKLVFFLNRATN